MPSGGSAGLSRVTVEFMGFCVWFAGMWLSPSRRLGLPVGNRVPSAARPGTGGRQGLRDFSRNWKPTSPSWFQ